MKRTAIILVAILALFSMYSVAFAADEKVGYIDDMAVLQQFRNG